VIGKKLSHLIKRGKLSFIGKPFYNALVSTELLYVRWKDGKEAFNNTPLVDKKLTALIKTFERPDALRRLVSSLKRFYPNMNMAPS